jgi:transglutaminase-like putative cysteine protease
MLHWLAQRRCLAMLCAALVLWWNLPQQAASAAADNPAAAQDLYQGLDEGLERFNAIVDTLAAAIDHGVYEVDSLAGRFATAEDAFVFLRDKIGYEPYAGSLRGAKGTLIARSGNALDRSLLLAALLARLGLTAEIASGRLGNATADRLAHRALEPRPGARALDMRAALQATRSLQIDPAALANLLRNYNQLIDDGQAAFWDKVEPSAAAVEAALQTDQGAQFIADWHELAAIAAQHFWVRYRNAAGEWISLDPSFPGAEPGQSFAQPTATFSADRIPDELRHWLEVTVTLRHRQGVDNPIDTVLVKFRRPVAELTGEVVRVVNLPQPDPPLLQPNTSNVDPLASITSFQTIIAAGDDGVASQTFGLDGSLTAEQGGTGGDTMGGMGKRVSDLLPPDSNAAQPAPPGQIIGQWLEYTLTGPDGDGKQPRSRHFRRDIVAPETVVDWSPQNLDGRREPVLTGVDAVRRLLVFNAELTPVTGAMSNDYVGYRQIMYLRSERDANGAVLRIGAGQPGAAGTVAGPRPFPGQALAWQGTMTELQSRLLSARYPELAAFVPTSGLIVQERQMSPSDGLPLRLRQSIDLVAIPMRLVAADDDPVRFKEGRAFSVLRGVMGCQVEHDLISAMLASLSPAASHPPQHNVAALTSSGLQQHVRLLGLRDGTADLGNLAALPFDPGIKAEIAAALAGGSSVVVPERSIDLGRGPIAGWWRVDAAAGEVIGVVPGGRGAAEGWLISTAKAIETISAVKKEIAILQVIIGVAIGVLVWATCAFQSPTGLTGLGHTRCVALAVLTAAALMPLWLAPIPELGYLVNVVCAALGGILGALPPGLATATGGGTGTGAGTSGTGAGTTGMAGPGTGAATGGTGAGTATGGTATGGTGTGGTGTATAGTATGGTATGTGTGTAGTGTGGTGTGTATGTGAGAATGGAAAGTGTGTAGTGTGGTGTGTGGTGTGTGGTGAGTAAPIGPVKPPHPLDAPTPPPNPIASGPGPGTAPAAVIDALAARSSAVVFEPR